MAATNDEPTCRWVDSSDGVRRCVVAGELDRNVRDRVAAALHAVPPGTAPHVDIDLGEVTFLDAAIAGVIIRYHAAVARYGGRVRVVNASGVPRRVLAITGPQLLDAVPKSSPRPAGPAGAGGGLIATVHDIVARSREIVESATAPDEPPHDDGEPA
ncbi:STAS domain-containing protein [Krasilnikovia sp. MM14-A1259]|uniref:STAS domain-containing protein n=1 Tax=Krasilnikovia sp. MM14-A1259 TaxID=3373539 RepID=UPI003811EC1A